LKYNKTAVTTGCLKNYLECPPHHYCTQPSNRLQDGFNSGLRVVAVLSTIYPRLAVFILAGVLTVWTAFSLGALTKGRTRNHSRSNCDKLMLVTAFVVLSIAVGVSSAFAKPSSRAILGYRRRY